MQLEQFIHNLRGQDKMRGEKEGVDIDRWVDSGQCSLVTLIFVSFRACLQGIYERVRAEEIRPGDDHVAQVARVDAAIVARDKPVREVFVHWWGLLSQAVNLINLLCYIHFYFHRICEGLLTGLKNAIFTWCVGHLHDSNFKKGKS